MKQNRLTFILVSMLSLVLILFLTACGSVDNKDSMPEENFYESIEIGGVSGGNQIYDPVKTDEEVYDRKIIRNAYIIAETKNYRDAVDAVQQFAEKLGGYVKESNVSGTSLVSDSGKRLTATFTICIPAEKLILFLNQVDGSLNVTSSKVSEDDITGNYYDLQSRIVTLTTERDRLTELLSSAENVQDMLTIQNRLYDVIEELEAKQSRLNVYNTKIALSTVQMTLYQVSDYMEADVELSFGERIIKAFSTSWIDFVKGWQSFAVWLVYAIPTLLVLTVIAGLVLLVVFARRKHSCKTKQSAVSTMGETMNKTKNE